MLKKLLKELNLTDKYLIPIVLMFISSIVIFFASLELSIDSLKIARDGSVSGNLSCDLGGFLSCSSVMSHPTAEMFGFPNSFLGLVSAGIMITFAVALLMKVKFPRLFMFMAQIGYFGGVIYAFILFYISVTAIHFLCPWCLSVQVTTLIAFFMLLRINILEDNLYLNKNISSKLKSFCNKGYDLMLMVAILVLFLSVIIINYL